MRVIVDTNTLLSMLLSRSGSMGQLFEHAVTGSYTLILIENVEVEYLRVVKTKPFFRQRFLSGQAEQFIDQVRSIAEYVSNMDYADQPFTRDKNDDFLISYALIIDADCLVTGDKDLLVIRHHLKRPQILTPVEFLKVLTDGQPDR